MLYSRNLISVATIRCLHIFCITVFMQCAIVIPVLAQGGTTSAVNTPKSASDLLVVSDGGSDITIYLVDIETGGLYSHKLVSNRLLGKVVDRLRFSEFTLLFKSPEFRHPSAIAFRDGKLLICDKEAPAIYELDPKNLTLNVLLTGKPLNKPRTVAVSDQGDIAVGNENSDTVILIKPKSSPKIIDYKFDDSVRLSFIGPNLIVMDERGDVFRVDPTNLTVSKVTLPSKLKATLDSPSDLGAYLNIFYFANGAGVAAFAQSNIEQFREYDVPLPVLFENRNEYSASRIFVNNRSLFVADNKTQSVLRLARPVPADIEFNGDGRETTIALATLYRHLYSRKILPLQEYKVERGNSIERILLDQQIIPSSLSSIAREIKTSLGELICDLNDDFCKANDILREHAVKWKVKAGQKLNLPNLQINEYETTTVVFLKDKTVGEYLREVIPSAERRRRYIETQLLKDNPPSVKDDPKKNILDQKGEFRLPVFRWKATVLISVDDISVDASSNLMGRLTPYKTYLFPKQEVQTRLASLTKGANSFRPPDANDPELVKKNRSDLRKDINFPDTPANDADLSGVYVAVGEKFNDVDFDHPDFVRSTNESIWFQLLPDGSDLPRRTLPANQTVPSVAIGEKFSDSDHGTHISGILAARSDSIAPGLIPSVKGLVLIDTTNPSAIRNLVQNAIRQGVFIFNFSFTLKNEAAMTNLKTSINGTDWSDRLFIVAAGKAEGGESQDLEVASEPPIRWIENSRNMIGVSAIIPVPGAGKFWMDPFVDEDGETQPGAKFGKRFVQLVAPGNDIYSSAKRNAYKKGSGTSQAVPQVTSAAAILFAKNVREPALIKARLMYASDWFPSFSERVYGGLLNVRRAAWEPTLDLIKTVTAPKVIKNIRYDGNPNISVTGGQIESPDGSPVAIPDGLKIKLNHIFRISRQPGPQNLVRVFFYDESTRKLRILINATLDGKINCRTLREWDEQQKRFKDPTACPNGPDGMDVSDLFDYVADIRKVPTAINF